jgi:hypothetical protein
MTETLLEVCLSAAPAAARLNGETEIRDAVFGLLAGSFPEGLSVSRRRERRFPFPKLARLIPLDREGVAAAEPMVVVGKQISAGGFGFFHQQPIAERHALLVFETPAGGRFAVTIELRWCRFTRHGWYESGGRFLRAVEPQ